MPAFRKLIEQEFGVKVTSEYKFHSTKKYRFDYAIVDLKIAIEKEGGIYTRQAHGSITGILRDIRKYNLATSMGWAVIRIPANEMFTLYPLNLIKDTIKNHYK